MELRYILEPFLWALFLVMARHPWSGLWGLGWGSGCRHTGFGNKGYGCRVRIGGLALGFPRVCEARQPGTSSSESHKLDSCLYKVQGFSSLTPRTLGSRLRGTVCCFVRITFL